VVVAPSPAIYYISSVWRDKRRRSGKGLFFTPYGKLTGNVNKVESIRETGE
jgi:hypothetical protein